MTILKWVVDYWKLIARHVYVFDNGSTDGSKEFLSDFDFVTVIDISGLTKNKLDDGLHIWLKNNMFKLLDSDFSIMCDMDECFYFNDIENTLTDLRKKTVIKDCGRYTVIWYVRKLLNTRKTLYFTNTMNCAVPAIQNACF